MRSVSTSIEILLLRHGPTSWSDQHRRQGWTDQPLTPAGRRAAQAWADRAPAEFGAVVSSDLQRARETARLIAVRLALGAVEELAGLREQDQGAWTGLTKDEVKREWPQRFRERPRRPVGGESPETVLRRVMAALAAVAASHGGDPVLAVTHSEVIRTLERAIEADAPPVPHLEGRWLTIATTRGPDGEPAVSSVRAGALTAGRPPVAGGVSATSWAAEGW